MVVPLTMENVENGWMAVNKSVLLLLWICDKMYPRENTRTD